MQERTFWSIVVLASTLFVAFLSWKVLDFFAGVVIMGAVTAYIVYPLTKKVNELGKRTGNRILGSYALSAFLSMLILIIPLVLLFFQTISFLTTSRGSGLLIDLIYYSPAIAAKIQSALNGMGLEVFSEVIGLRVREMLLNFGVSVTGTIASFSSRVFIQVPVYLITTYYFIRDGPRIVDSINRRIPKNQEFLVELMKHVERIAHGLFIGHVVTSLIGMFIATAGFMVMGAFGIVPFMTTAYAVFLGILVGVCMLLPLIGTPIIFVPIVFWLLSTQPAAVAVVNSIIILAFDVVFLMLLPDFYIRPTLAGKSGSIHPLIVLLGFIGGPLIWGVKGLVLGPLGLGLAQATLQTYIKYKN
ncbi:MAG: AI-2E family transporter [archaeon]